jgi:hypothetical protein
LGIPPNTFNNLQFGKAGKYTSAAGVYGAKTDAFPHQWIGNKGNGYSGSSPDPTPLKERK